jgi:SAM-dependent methyltransferase
MIRKLKKWIEKTRQEKLRKVIAEAGMKGTILDNGCGETGSWNYKADEKVVRADILYGVDCEKLPYRSWSFDSECFAGVIQYVDLVKSMSECRRVLKENGIFVISCLNANSLWNKFTSFKTARTLWSPDGFKKFVESFGFEVLEEKMIDFDWIPDKYKMVIYLRCKKR